MQPQPSPLSSFLPFFGHGQTWAIAEKKMLTGNKIFCCLQAYKLISDQCWCLLKKQPKKKTLFKGNQWSATSSVCTCYGQGKSACETRNPISQSTHRDKCLRSIETYTSPGIGVTKNIMSLMSFFIPVLYLVHALLPPPVTSTQCFWARWPSFFCHLLPPLHSTHTELPPSLPPSQLHDLFMTPKDIRYHAL